MELVLKQPKDKPPFLGILFTSEYTGSKLNSDFVINHKGEFFKLTIEPVGSKINITIASEYDTLKYTYLDVKYDFNKLKEFIIATRQVKLFNFSHLKLQENKHIVLKTLAELQLFVIKINEVTVVGFENE